MTTTRQHMTLKEYLEYDDGTDTRYTLVDGELVVVPSESDLNNVIALYILSLLLQFVPIQRMRRGTEIVVSGSRATTRIPDLMVVGDELDAELAGSRRSIVMLDMPSPELVVEVVSSGAENIERDYRYKRSEYAARGIAEYWIVDPVQRQVVVLALLSGLYEDTVFKGTQQVRSPLIPDLKVMAEQLLRAGR
ncbi:MAG: Uma2 family endonuclease [Elainellaceae cyanobacterium]